MNRRQNYIIALSFFVIFSCIFAFFYYAHPLLVFDGDDWYGVSAMRAGAIPNPLSYNPIKVLPETLFPLMGRIAVTFIYPWKKDYLRSVSLVLAVLMAVSITAYTYSFYDFLKRRIRKGKISALLLSILFLLFHFLIFRKERLFNDYMFTSNDSLCYFHYILPFLLNTSMVMFFFSRNIEDIFSKKNIGHKVIKKSALILSLYLCLFSNLFQNGILATFFIISVLYNFYKSNVDIKEKSIRTFVLENKIKLTYIFCWLVSMFIESRGERAAAEANGSSLIERITLNRFVENIVAIVSRVKMLNRLFIPIVVGG